VGGPGDLPGVAQEHCVSTIVVPSPKGRQTSSTTRYGKREIYCSKTVRSKNRVLSAEGFPGSKIGPLTGGWGRTKTRLDHSITERKRCPTNRSARERGIAIRKRMQRSTEGVRFRVGIGRPVRLCGGEGSRGISKFRKSAGGLVCWWAVDLAGRSKKTLNDKMWWWVGKAKVHKK